MSILCKETEHLHKINQELQKDNRELRNMVEKLHEILHKDKTTCGFWEYGKEPYGKESSSNLDSTIHEKIRVLEIENAGKTRQLRKLEIDIAKIKESKQTDAMSFTQLGSSYA